MRRDRAVKGRVEDGDVRDVGQRGQCLTDGDQSRLVVQRRERPQPLDPGDDRGVDHHGLDEARAAVDDSVPDRLGRRVAVDGAHLVSLDQ